MLFGLSKKLMLAGALDQTGCGEVLRKTPVWRGVLILNYHRIGDCTNSLLDRRLWSATTADFDRQIAAIKYDFPIIGLDELPAALNDPRGRYVMITFDDGYRDNYEIAYPILRKHNVPATFFITTGLLDIPQVPWWDEIAWMIRTTRRQGLEANPWTITPIEFKSADLEAEIHRLQRIYKGLEGHLTEGFLSFLAEKLETGRVPTEIARQLWMDWQQIREMRNHGMTFGGHTVNHPVLSNLPAPQQDYEVGFCQQRLMEELGEPIETFSYPVGGPGSFNTATLHALESHGYRWAFTYFGGHIRPRKYDRYTLARTAIETDIGLSTFQAIATIPQWFA